jgi:membrane fusion protein, multidrug efflux system
MNSIKLFFFAALTLLLVSCSGNEETDNAQIEADISPVTAKINGAVIKVFADDNQQVKEGDTILLLDDANYKIAVMQAEVALAQAQQNVQLAKSSKGVVNSSVNSATSSANAVSSNMAAAIAGVEAAKVKLSIANKNFQRYENLYNQKSATLQQYEIARAERDGAEQSVRIAQGQIVSLNGQIEASKSQVNTSKANISTSVDNIALAELNVKQAENALAAAKLQLSYCTITAPATGIISKKNVQKGQVVSVGQPLMAVTDNNKMWVVANFKETQIEKIKEGLSVTIEIDAYGKKKFSGKVASFSQATGAKFSLLPPDNATGNFVKVTQRIPIKIEFTEPTSKEFPLRAGMSVSVTINTK